MTEVRRVVAALKHCGLDKDGYTDADLADIAEAVIAEVFPETNAGVAFQAYKTFVQAIIANTTNGVCPVCSYLWSECECGVARYR